MSLPSTHVAEKPDLLAPDAAWRQQLADVAQTFTRVLPAMKHLLESRGAGDAMERAPIEIPMLARMLLDIENKLNTSMVELKQSKAEWDRAIRERTGELANLDSQGTRWDGRIKDLQLQYSEHETKLENLKDQVTEANTALESTQATIRVKQQGHEEEANRLKALADKHRSDTNDLSQCQQQYAAHVQAFEAREHQFNDRWAAFNDNDKRKQAIMDAKEKDLDKRSRDANAREQRLSEAEDTMIFQKDKNKQNASIIISVHSALKVLAKTTGSDSGITVSDIQGLVLSIQRRFNALQQNYSDRQKEVAKHEELTRRAESELENMGKELGDLKLLREHESGIYQNSLNLATVSKGRQTEIISLKERLVKKTQECSSIRSRDTHREAANTELERQLGQANIERQQFEEKASGLECYTIPKLKAEGDSLRLQINTLTRKKEDLEKQRNVRDADMTELKARVDLTDAITQQEISQYVEKVQAIERVEAALRLEIASLKSTYAMNQYAHIETRKRFTHVQRINNEYGSNTKSMIEALQAKTQTVNELKLQDGVLRQDVANGLNKIAKLGEEVELLQDEKKQSTLDLKDQTEQHTQAEQRLESSNKALSQILSGKEREVTTLSQRIEAFKTTSTREIDKLRSIFEEEVKDSEAKCGQLKGELDAKENCIERLAQQLKDLTTTTSGEAAKLRDELRKAGETIKRLENEKQSLFAEVAETSREIDRLQQQVLGQAGNLNQCRAENQRLRADMNSLNSQLVESRDTATREANAKTSKESENNELRSDCSAKYMKIGELEGKIQLLEADSDQTRDQTASLNNELNNLREEVLTKTRYISQLQGEIGQLAWAKRELDGVQKTHEGQVNSLNIQTNRLHVEVRGKDDQISQLEVQVHDADQRFEALKQEARGIVDKQGERIKRLEEQIGQFEISSPEIEPGRSESVYGQDLSDLDIDDDLDTAPGEKVSSASSHSSDARMGLRGGQAVWDKPSGAAAQKKPVSRKRKAVESDSEDGDDVEASVGQGSSWCRNGIGAGGNAQRDSVKASTVTWSLKDIHDPAFNPKDVSDGLLQKLRAKIGFWKTSKVGWDTVAKPPRCVESRLRKRGSEWSNGEQHQCSFCAKIRSLCVVVVEEGKLILHPAICEGKPAADWRSMEYWTGA